MAFKAMREGSLRDVRSEISNIINREGVYVLEAKTILAASSLCLGNCTSLREIQVLSC